MLVCLVPGLWSCILSTWAKINRWKKKFRNLVAFAALRHAKSPSYNQIAVLAVIILLGSWELDWQLFSRHRQGWWTSSISEVITRASFRQSSRLRERLQAWERRQSHWCHHYKTPNWFFPFFCHSHLQFSWPFLLSFLHFLGFLEIFCFFTLLFKSLELVFSAAITPDFSFTWFFRNQYNILIWRSY